MIAWSELVEEYGPMVYRAALRIVGQPADAEDVVQEVFLEVHRLWQSRSVNDWQGVLRTLAVRRSLDSLRRRPSEDSLQGDVVPGDADDPYEAACVRELEDFVRSAIARLPPQQAEVLSLHYLEGLSHAQIADELQITRQGVAAALHKARARLVQDLERVSSPKG